jgi:DNA sulfur modification protein DndB
MTDFKPPALTKGHLVAGVRVDDHTFVGRVETALLFTFAPDPRSDDGHDELDPDPHTLGLRVVRERARRLFKGSKEANVADYAGYLVNVPNAEFGDAHHGALPPILLWSPKELKVEAITDELGYLRIPYDARLIALDGQTQLAARYHARKRLTRAIDSKPATVMFCHGRSVAWAKQTLFDLHLKAVPTSRAAGSSLDTRAPSSRLVRRLVSDVEAFETCTDDCADTREPELMTFSALRLACITLSEGISGLSSALDAEPAIDDERMERLEPAALMWFSTVTRRYRAWFEEDGSLIGSPVAMAALGAVGHDLVGFGYPYSEEQAVLADKLASLGPVDWSKGPHWDGIAGKLDADGNLVVGSPMEYAESLYTALTDEWSDAYRRIRTEPSPAEEAGSF